MTTRRHFLQTAGAFGIAPSFLFARKEKLSGVKFGVTDWNLRLPGKPDALALAARIGFEGVEVSLGRSIQHGKLPLANVELQGRYLTGAKKYGIAIDSTCLDILHTNYLKNDKLGQKWVAEGIEITRKLGAPIMLLPFFGKGALTTRAETDYVGDVLRELASAAEKANVVLGLENTLSAKDNVRILKRARAKAVLVYYDVGNSTNAGFNVVKEIRWLGKDRICQIHLKDGRGYLGAGKINFSAVMRAIAHIKYAGFIDLETACPSGSVEGDMRRNLLYIIGLVKEIRNS